RLRAGELFLRHLRESLVGLARAPGELERDRQETGRARLLLGREAPRRLLESLPQARRGGVAEALLELPFSEEERGAARLVRGRETRDHLGERAQVVRH